VRGARFKHRFKFSEFPFDVKDVSCALNTDEILQIAVLNFLA